MADFKTTGKLAAVGELSSIIASRALGVHTVAADSPAEVADAVDRLAAAGYTVIFLTEPAAEQVPEVLRRYKSRAYPILLPLPDRTGSTGFGRRGINANVEKAIGSNIFQE